MKFFRILGRNIRDSFRSVFRNYQLSFASIICIAITLIVVAIAIVLSANVNNLTEEIEKDVTIVVFLDNKITKQEINKIKEDINSIVGIESVNYQSKTEISEEMMKSSKVYQNIMQDWTRDTNPLQDTYLVKVNDIEQIGTIAKKIEKFDNVGVVKYGEGMVEQLVSIFEVVKKSTYALVIALILVTGFLISNTIKITIFSRKREIEIMRLVGASNINIKIPFILEGLFLGLFGAIIPIIITVYGYSTLYEHFDGYLFTPLISLIEPNPFILVTSLLLLVIAVLVGMIGSLNAVRKYLKI